MTMPEITTKRMREPFIMPFFRPKALPNGCIIRMNPLSLCQAPNRPSPSTPAGREGFGPYRSSCSNECS
jgi:hypothetical protein